MGTLQGMNVQVTSLSPPPVAAPWATSFRRRTRLCALAAALLLPGMATAANPVNVDRSGVAIHGYDPVAYFTIGKPTMGKAEFNADSDGATYWFADASNMKAFQADPPRYTPQFGGFCAYGVAQGHKPDIDPTAFSIVDGKLYLNLDAGVKKRWLANVPGYIEQANKNWRDLVKK